jgi:phosphonate transport system substrate-binding protein
MGTWKIIVVGVVLLALAIGVSLFFGGGVKPEPTTRPATPDAETFRVALVPEYDVFELRKSYRGLMDYLSSRVGRKVEIVTLNSYGAVLKEFQEKKIDAAFLGSLMAVMTMECCETQPVVRPESDGVSTYRGVIFVKEDSPVKSLDGLGGKSIAMLKATTAGSLFPLAELHRRGLLPQRPDDAQLVWMGTHDEVIAAVMSGRAEVGAVKDLRLEAYLKAHPQVKIRRLAMSDAVPNNALMVRKDVLEKIGSRLQAVMLGMQDDPEARAALGALRVQRFIPCDEADFKAVYELVDRAGEAWERVGIPGAGPKKPPSR